MASTSIDHRKHHSLQWLTSHYSIYLLYHHNVIFVAAADASVITASPSIIRIRHENVLRGGDIHVHLQP